MKQSTKSLKSIVLIFSAVLLVLTSFPYAALAENELTTGSCGDNATYSFDTTTGTLTISGTGEVKGGFDTSIKSKIKFVIIEEGITSLSGYSFTNFGNLQSVVFPDSLISIGYAAFREATSLTEINIPKNVNSIGSLAFSFSSHLEKITVAEGNEYFVVVDNVLFNKDMTKLLLYAPMKTETSYTIPNSVTSIADEAFEVAQNLVEIEFSDGLKTIGISAFFSCKNLQSIKLSSTISDIAFNAFQSCENVRTITVDEANEYFTAVDNVLFNKNMTELLLYACQKADPSYTVPNSVTSIADYSFEYAVNLSNVELPEGLNTIGNNAFYSCKNLKNITIPSTVTDIGSDAFYCENLEKIVFKSDNCQIKVTVTQNGYPTTIYKTATIYANYDSTGQNFAEKYGYNFVPLCSDGTDNHDFDVLLTYSDDCLSLTTTFTCKNCGYSYEENEELFGHVWGNYIYKEETRSHYRICANDETHIEEQSCYIGDADVTEPTCTETGKIIYTCAVCNGTWTEELDKLPHEYEAVVTAPTCTQNGFTTYICSACGDTYIDDTTDIISHEYVESVTAPTCTEQGYTTYTCKNCGDTYTADYTDALGHNFDDSERDCLNGCGEENPNYTETITDPTDPENTTVAEPETTVKATEATTHIKKSETANHTSNNDYTGSRDTAYDDFRIIPGYGQIKAALTNDSKLDGYEVYISTDNKNFKKIDDIKVKSADYCIIDDLSTGQVYYVKVKGYLYHNDKKIEMSSFSNTQSLSVK